MENRTFEPDYSGIKKRVISGLIAEIIFAVICVPVSVWFYCADIYSQHQNLDNLLLAISGILMGHLLLSITCTITSFRRCIRSVSVSEKIITIPVTITESSEKSENAPDSAPGKDTAKQSVTKQIGSVAAQITAAASTVKTPEASKPGDKTTKATVGATVRSTAATTKKRAVVDDKINEKSVGIFMLSKTDPVQVGNQATVFIQGTPGKTYSIEFYETPSSTAKLVELEDKKADANGFVSWSFEIRNTCNLGKRKLIIKEKGSDNYIETSITVR